MVTHTNKISAALQISEKYQQKRSSLKQEKQLQNLVKKDGLNNEKVQKYSRI